MATLDRKPLEAWELPRLVRGEHHDPHAVLGPHPWGQGVTVRVLDPLARNVVVRGDWGEIRLDHEYQGVWVGVIPGTEVPRYWIVTEHADGTFVLEDPYRFAPTLTGEDLFLIGEGRQELLWLKLGAHIREYDGVSGTSFSVWAPYADGVRVAPESGPRDARALPMRKLGLSGVWDLFVPGIGPGTRYQFEIFGADGKWRDKADPMAFQAAIAPDAFSIVHESRYWWNDGQWMADRQRRQADAAPMSIYEMHVGSWRRGRSWEQLADELPGYLTDMGFTHVELMPVMNYPYEPSWGYQLTSYFAPDSRRGDPDGLKLLIDRLHQAGIGVILDWVPAHFAVDEWSLCQFDGTQLYEDPNPMRGWHPEWQTYIFDFGRHEVRNFLYASALYWLSEYHADGLRVDAVSSMLYLDYARPYGNWQPNRHGGNENLEAVHFLQEMNATAYRRIPGIVTIAEESTAWPGITKSTGDWGLGFGLKWNMGWMHDSLEYLAHEPKYRSWHYDQLVGTLDFAWSEKYVLPLSHDEVTHGKGSLLTKMPGDRQQQFATLRAYLALMWAYPGKKLLFMGSEFAQVQEWQALGELHWEALTEREHWGMQSLVRDLNHLYADLPTLWTLDSDPDAFERIAPSQVDSNVFSFVRRGVDTPDVVCVTNFAETTYPDYLLGLPGAGEWQVILNTNSWRFSDTWDSPDYPVSAVAEPCADQPASVRITLPALTTLWLQPRA